LSEAAYVTFDQVQKSYDGKTLVVEDLDLHIREGEFLTMLGPSGSGKTTCLMMLAGFETARMAKSASAAKRLIASHRTSAALGWCFRITRCFRI
jgi:ABC-type spermidine/putrescine transport systems, ATPase components